MKRRCPVECNWNDPDFCAVHVTKVAFCQELLADMETLVVCSGEEETRMRVELCKINFLCTGATISVQNGSTTSVLN